MIFQAVELLATFAEALAGMMIIGKISGEGAVKWRKSLAASAGLSVVVWMLNQYKLFSPWIAVVSVAGFVINAIIIYKTELAEAMLIAVTYVMLLYIIDFLSIAVLGVIFQREQVADLLINSFSFERIGLIILAKALLGFIYIILERYILRDMRFRTWKAWIGVLIGLGLIYWFMNNTLSKADGNMVLTGAILLALLLLGAYAASERLSHVREKGELTVVVERSSIMAEDYREATENYRKNQIFYHDLKNHHLIIEEYLKNGEYEKARQYMEALETAEGTELPKRWTGIDALDILLEYKKKEAKTLGIKVEITAVPICLDLSEQEITAVLGNAFDNAIEACREVKNGEKWIGISIRKVREMTFIKVSNSCEEELEGERGRLVSKKQDKSLHGLGMISMEQVVSKYGGIMDIKWEDGIFCVVFLFFC